MATRVRMWSRLLSRWLPVPVAVAAERDLELGADLRQHVGRVEVVPHVREPIAVRLETSDGAHRVAVAVRIPVDEEPLAAVQPRLDARDLRQHIGEERRIEALEARRSREPQGTEEHALEDATPRRLGPVLRGNPHDLDLGRVEKERSEPIEIARVERGAEGIEDLRLRRSFTLVRRLDELAPSAMQRRLDGARRRGERLGDLLQREVERLLEHHRRALLRREPREERTRRFADRARLPAGCALRIRFGLRLLGADAVDPQARPDPEEPRARILGRLVHTPPLLERTEEHVLNEIVGVPRTAGQVPAVAEEFGPKRLVEIEEAVPRRLDVVTKRVGHCWIWLVHARGTEEKGRTIARSTRLG